MFKAIHKHLLVRALTKKTIYTKKEAKEFLTDIVANIRMVPVTKPQAVYVATPGNEGFTGSINLATSHVAFHIWDDQHYFGGNKGTNMLMLDVYSCCDFEEEQVKEIIARLGIIDYESTIIDRTKLINYN